jgi:hypothetical protein
MRIASTEHEEALIRSFILPSRRDRYFHLMANRKARQKLRLVLAHCKDIVLKYAYKLPPKEQTLHQIEVCLKKVGAPSICYAISENTEIDSLELPLHDALVKTVGKGFGTILSCIPGKLAYYESEDPGERYILKR